MALFFPTFAALLGLIIGSFLNVVIHRGPAMWNLVDDDTRRGNLAFPRSYCPACQTPISRWRLLPVAGFIALNGKCASCGASIPIRYLVVELLGATAALGAFLMFGLSVTALLAAIFFWLLIALAVIDFETGFLPDALTLPLIIIGLLANMGGIIAPITDAVIGAAVGFLAFWIIGIAFHRIRGIEGLGLGDAKLLSAIGAWLGWQALAPVVLAAALIGLTGVFAMRLRGKEINATTPIPFGPALCASGALILIVGALTPHGGYLAALAPIFP